jgi:Leucine-rich repeat (LRR) protein
MLFSSHAKAQVLKTWTFLHGLCVHGLSLITLILLIPGQWILAISISISISISIFTSTDAVASQPGKPHRSDARAKTSEKESAASRTVTLNFPSKSIGMLYLTKVESHGQLTQLKELDVARDTVHATVPPDRWLLLRCVGLVLQKPNSLNTLAPDDLDALDVTATPLEDIETFTGRSLLTNISKLTGLRLLVLKQFPAVDLELSRLSTLKKLQHLTIELCEMDGSCVKALSTLPELYDLDLSFNQLKPENLRSLKDFRKLKRLILHDCKLDDSAIANIANCTNVEDLALNENIHLTDASMKSLASMKNLKLIDLKGTRISVRGLAELSGLKHLSSIAVSEGYMTPEQLASLQDRFPHTKISFSRRTTEVDKDMKRIFAPMPR